MEDMEWFKFYGAEYLSDPKMMALTVLERCCWITLLSIASVSDDAGRVRFITPERLLMLSGVDPTQEAWLGADAIMKKYESLGMVSLESNGDVIICNWQKRQNSYLTGAERAKRYRNKIKSNEKVTEPSDERNARIEKNRIEKNRKEIHTSAKADEYTIEFQSFWKAYPRKTAKGLAWKAWQKLKNRPLVTSLIKEIDKQKQSTQWQEEGGKFIPHPATWLNQKRWEDETVDFSPKVHTY